MLAYVWRTMIWFVAGTAVALGFLLVPLEVASQRKQLDRTTAQIVEAERDIRALQTEFDTRANYAQVEQWNGQQLGLSAPVAEQFVDSEAALARVDVQDPTASAQIQTASFVPSGPPSPEAMTRVIPHAAVAAEQARTARVAPAMASAQAPAHVAIALARPVAVQAVATQTAAPRATPVARSRPQAVAMLDRGLLSGNTLRELTVGARSEADHLR